MHFILLAEDNPDHAELIEDTIRECQSQVVLYNCHNGEEVLQYLNNKTQFKQQLPDLIIMDIKMPRMNGIEALIAIKQNPALNKIPVMMLSTATNQTEMDTCLRHGANLYFVKPLQTDDFQQRVLPLLIQTQRPSHRAR